MALVDDLVQGWHDNFTVDRVFGDPVQKDGVTIIPVAKVSGGGGGGSGQARGGGEEGSGGGFGGLARPVGVYEVRADGVKWRPALNMTILGIAGMALVAFIAVIAGGVALRWR